MKTIDWSGIYKKYKGNWVALAEDEITVLAAAKSAKEALSKAKNKGYKNPILTKMPKKLVTYVGAGV